MTNRIVIFISSETYGNNMKNSIKEKPSNNNPKARLSRNKTSIDLGTAKAEPMNTHRLKKIMASPIAPAVLSLMVILFAVSFLLPFSNTEAKSEDLSFMTSTTKDQSAELGDYNISQVGVKGTSLVTYKYTGTLFDLIFRKGNTHKEEVSSNMTKVPTKEIINQGTKKYQYMHCSNGSYRFYTDNQFKDPNTGFTHKSKDYCAENNEGAMAYLADTPNITKAESIEFDKVAEVAKLKAAMSTPTATLGNKPEVNTPTYTAPVETGNPEARQLCINNYNSAIARAGTSSNNTDYANLVNHAQSTYNLCLKAAGY